MSTAEPLRPLAASRVALVAAVALAELAVIVLVGLDFACYPTLPESTCGFFSAMKLA